MNEENITSLTRKVMLEKSPFWVEVTGFHIDGEENSWCEGYVGCIFKVRQFQEVDFINYTAYTLDIDRFRSKKKELYIVIEVSEESSSFLIQYIKSILRKQNFKRLPDMKC